MGSQQLGLGLREVDAGANVRAVRVRSFDEAANRDCGRRLIDGRATGFYDIGDSTSNERRDQNKP